ncbi:MAG: undecaprenyl-diphosphate phosphatase [Nanoarchaeota archaeon]|nr:undecaprenyl-diphosphate phosphatase [Nanoarchaeota archaeon]MBU1135565.1 undecaprenyl-diphosphate phosphatase [Nanoarchaeota archaeon]MBU2520370.1 undecaprenyl-diphosphate phosphatase [Nanoarchaeota archaeon]
MDIFSSVVLGIVQGITEWLPISSSGHLAIFEKLFSIRPDAFFNIMLHFATLLVVFFVFRKEIYGIAKAVVKLDFKGENGKMFLFLIVGSIPIAIAGFLFEEIIYSLFSNIILVGFALIFTGTIIYLSKFSVKKLGLDSKRSFAVGLFQALALIPGVSRSGSTVSSALLMGIEREKAVVFSMLLSIPAILGATMFLMTKNTIAIIQPELIAGMIVSLVVGYFSLKFLIKTILDKKFYLFSVYCWIVGLIVILISFV